MGKVYKKEKDIHESVLSNVEFLCELAKLSEPLEFWSEPAITPLILDRPIIPVDIIRKFNLKKPDILIKHKDLSYSVIEIKLINQDYKKHRLLIDGVAQLLGYQDLIESFNLKAKVRYILLADIISPQILRIIERHKLNDIHVVEWSEGDCKFGRIKCQIDQEGQ